MSIQRMTRIAAGNVLLRALVQNLRSLLLTWILCDSLLVQNIISRKENVEWAFDTHYLTEQLGQTWYSVTMRNVQAF